MSTLQERLYPPPPPPPEPEHEPAPRLPWPAALLVFAAVLAAWWPQAPYWLSDDWLVVHHAADLGRALGDFANNHGGVRGAVWFYRPLVTLGFALENLLAGGPDPFVSHLSNAVALALSAALLATLAARFFGATTGFLAGLVWGISAVHAGVVLWVCGRTAAFSEPWILAAAWCAVRWVDGMRCGRWLALACCALGLATKEIAVVTPGVVAVLAFAAASPGRRLATAARATWPLLLLLVAYFGLRYAVLGHVIGGYVGDRTPPEATALGLATWTGRLLNPAALLGGDSLAQAGLPAQLLGFWWAGFAVALAAAALLVRRHGALALLALLLLYLGCVAPSAQFWPQTDSLHNLRLFTLPFAPLAVLLAAGRWWTALPALVLAAGGFVEVRQEYADAYATSERIHRQLRSEARILDAGPVFLHGLPRRTEHGAAVLFHLGVDRLLQPPFAEPPGRRTFALRPLAQRPDALRLPYGERRGLPLGHTVALLPGGTGIGQLTPDRRPGIAARVEGAARLDGATLTAMHAGTISPAFLLGGPAAPHYRVTVFTAGGYVSAVLPNEAPAGTDGGRVTLAAWLQAPTTEGAGVVTDLVVPAAVDLDLRLPVMIEAGEAVFRKSGALAEFRATHVGEDFVWVELGEDYAAFIDPRS